MDLVPTVSNIAYRRGFSGWLRLLVQWGAAVLFLMLMATMVFGMAVVLYVGIDPELEVRVNTEPLALLALAVLLLLLQASWMVASGRKKIVLYLRRFRRTAANEALSAAMHGALRSCARLVVLDDARLQPVSVPLRERLLTLASALPVLAGLLLVAAVGSSVKGPVVIEDTYGGTNQHGIISIAPRATTAVDRTQYSGLPVLLDLPGALGLWAVLGLCGLLSVKCVRSSAQARSRVARQQDIAAVVKHMQALGGWMAAPKPLGALATVVSVEDACWQDVVTALAAHADAIVLDVSEPTGPIWWEISHCVERHPQKLLLIMDAADNFTRHPTAPDPADVKRLAVQASRTRHGGVLPYQPGLASSRAHFQQQLRAFVSALPAHRRRHA